MADSTMGTSLSLPSGGIVFMLSGQGSQKPGMGADLLGIPEVASAFECASRAFGFDVADLVCSDDAARINDTRFAQPALCALSVGIAHALEARGVSPAAVLGFSLGQIGALAVAGMLSDEETFALVRRRTDLMAEAADAHPGAMSALLKGTDEEVEELCARCAQGQVLVPANYNSPGQVVISGELEAIARAEEEWAAMGKRASRLKTSGAFHSPLMADAAEGLASYMEGVTFSEPRIPLVCNVDAAPLSAAGAREHLALQMTHPVRFVQCVRNLADAGAGAFVEVGFGGVLANLVKRIDKELPRECVQNESSFNACVETYGAAGRE